MNYNKERLNAVDGRTDLYRLVEILDRYNLGCLAMRQPGEYTSEARMINQERSKFNNKDDVYKYLIYIVQHQFGWKIRPVFRRQYKRASKEIYDMIVKM